MTQSISFEFMLGYKAWADNLILQCLGNLPQSVLTQPQPIVFGTLLHTINHAYRIDRIWQHHLQGIPSPYQNKTPSNPHSISPLKHKYQTFNSWLQAHASQYQPPQFDELIDFTFINGSAGSMTRGQILLHLCHHSTYHRGHIADMLYQSGYTPPTTDLPVYIEQQSQPR